MCWYVKTNRVGHPLAVSHSVDNVCKLMAGRVGAHGHVAARVVDEHLIVVNDGLGQTHVIAVPRAPGAGAHELPVWSRAASRDPATAYDELGAVLGEFMAVDLPHHVVERNDDMVVEEELFRGSDVNWRRNWPQFIPNTDLKR